MQQLYFGFWYDAISISGEYYVYRVILFIWENIHLYIKDSIVNVDYS